ncbi:hypothetical protein HXA31_10160 [Salipaludibacillus agaradhaerens]|jgi:glucan phosphoethanolaminetransferase (alkaline phosphatase superfamily)|uniref:Uncharacterized protein n=1 Tax=Salipaludibacillus agaradhaerens TaxID=76935 RepID=A0A9Q4FXV0_SALAG|nr:hypothetical protein [Salipaludibacillus agaradhaerens]MCR6095701.1 hypothetical protein [Salipaludibacillus agaradhaerens]MCR6114739.1 hypothetical protein [Salipaludibacillus agaradhaerens]
MEKLLKWIGLAIFLGWTVAILANFSVYQHSTRDTAGLNPMVEGILFMAMMLGVYIIIWKSFEKNRQVASIQLVVLGCISLGIAVLLL